MRKELLAATILSSAALAISADFPAHAQALSPYNWTGFYIGGGAGGHFGSDAAFLDLPDGDPADFGIVFEDGSPRFPGQAGLALRPWDTRYELDELNPALGAHAGYNYQVGQFVFGVEADWYWLGDRSSDTFSSTDAVFIGATPGLRTTDVTVHGGVESLFTLRPRVGFAVADRLLLFATGGLAIGDASIGSFADVSEEYTDQAKSAAASWAGEDSSWELGYTLGGGAEYAVTDRISVRLEGLYYDLGEISTRVDGSGSETDGGTVELTAQPYTARMDADGAIGRVGFSFRF